MMSNREDFETTYFMEVILTVPFGNIRIFEIILSTCAHNKFNCKHQYRHPYNSIFDFKVAFHFHIFLVLIVLDLLKESVIDLKIAHRIN